MPRRKRQPPSKSDDSLREFARRGGIARMARLTKAERVALARLAARTRWGRRVPDAKML